MHAKACQSEFPKGEAFIKHCEIKSELSAVSIDQPSMREPHQYYDQGFTMPAAFSHYLETWI
jgi:hypothetical protein